LGAPHPLQPHFVLLWLAMLQRFGVDVERFGDAERPLF
jgi:hypothetical protein